MQQVKEEQMKTELSSLVSDKNVAKKYQKEYKETGGEDSGLRLRGEG